MTIGHGLATCPRTSQCLEECSGACETSGYHGRTVAPILQAPFPWFGGKRRVAPEVWARLGNVQNYVEPFFGSGAVLLGRPHPPGIETVNDLDGYVANFWRALQHAPEDVARWADWPVNENDLHARHTWLRARRETLRAILEGNPDYYDAQIAGWWVWGLACWIGGGFCGDSGAGPWIVDDQGQLVHLGDAGRGVTRQLVHLGDAGRGVKRQLVHLGDAGQGVKRKRVHLGSHGRGVARRRVHLGHRGMGVAIQSSDGLLTWFRALSERLRHVRVCSGDWTRILGPTPTVKQGLTGVFLDPPYSAETTRDMALYTEDSDDVAHAVRAWAIAHGEDPLLRIALCGYESEHPMPASWSVHAWLAHGGYAMIGHGAGALNRHRERVWFSPHCLAPTGQGDLFVPTVHPGVRGAQGSRN